MAREQSGEASNRRKQGLVIAVSGTSGAGKTTLAQRVVALLKDAVFLSFDDYVALGNDPADIKAWLEAGANPDDLKTPQLAVDLRKLASGEPVRLPNDGRVIEPAEFIVLEEPFGRARGDVAALVDFAAHLDLPADVALARRVIRAIESQVPPCPGPLLERIHYDLRAYLAAGRDAYRTAESAARKSADMVLDGMRPIDELAADLVAAIDRHRA